MTQKTVKVHWLHSKGPEAVFALRMSHDKESVCINKDSTADAILRSTLAQLELEPTSGLKIHSWKLSSAEQLHYFFIDDEQNNLVKQGFTTACSS